MRQMELLMRFLIRRFLQMLTFAAYVWWFVIIKTTGTVLGFLFGKNYKLSMYGSTLRNTKFRFDANVALTNHGSYGAIPLPVQEAQREYNEATEQCPDNWFCYKLQPLWNKSLQAAARFVGASPDNLVFIPNTTVGINTVLRCLDIAEGSHVLTTNQTYGAIQMAVQEMCQERKAKLIVLNVNFPTSDFTGSATFYVQDIVKQYSQVLDENPAVEFAVIDYITSSSALRLPVEQLIKVCHSHGVIVIIDGAHAPGQVELNLEKLGADFFIGNLHKWLFTPRGCAILWVNPKFQDIIDPLVVSWFHDHGLQDRFFQQGTTDYTSYATVPAAIKFYHEIGGLPGISKYNRQLISWASTMLADAWNTEILPVPDSMRAPFMMTIQLPKDLNIVYGTTNEGPKQMMEDLYNAYQVAAAVVCIQSSLWCRISAQVYNTKEDYTRLAEAVLNLRDGISTGCHPGLLSKWGCISRWSSNTLK